MKEHEINECLKLWLKVERKGERDFAFHHILKGKEMVMAENVENMNVKVDRKGKERKERGVTENSRKTKGPKGAKKMKKEDVKQRDVEHATEDQDT